METAKMREEQCKIMEMETMDIIEYLEAYGAEHDLPNKIRMMIDQLKIRLELGMDEDDCCSDELCDIGDTYIDEAKLIAIQAYAAGVSETADQITDFINHMVCSDIEEDS